MLFYMCVLSLSRREPFLRSSSLGQGVVLDRRVFRFRKSFLFSIFRSKLCNRIRNQNCNKVKILEHFICLILVCDVLCVITLVITSHNDPSYD
jgi:hypothetical protein